MVSRAGIYIRVSSAQQAKGASLDTQEEAARRYCDEHGYEVVAVYRDVHTGAELFERSGMTSLLDNVRDRRLEVVVAHALDRLSRSQHHQGVIFTECDRRQVAIEFSTEKLEDTPEGRLLSAVHGFMSEVERLKIRERTMRGIRARVADGKALGKGVAPFGYRYVAPDYNGEGAVVRGTLRTHYEADPAAVDHLRWVFTQADAGTSLRRIGFGLEERGVLPPYHDRTGSTKWHASTVRDVLSNTSYVGDGVAYKVQIEKVPGRQIPERQRNGAREYGIVATRREIAAPGEIDPSPQPATAIPLAPGVFPPLVDRAIFARVQARLAAKAVDKTESQRADRDPKIGLLRRGMVRCPICKTALTVNKVANGGPQYRHDAKARHHHGCPHVGIQIEALDAQVWAWVGAITTDPVRSERLFNRLGQDEVDDGATAAVAAYDRRVAEIGEAQGVLEENMGRVTGGLFDQLAGKWQALDDERAKLEADRQRWTVKVADAQERRERVERMRETCADVRARLGTIDVGEKRQALRDLGAVVWLHPGDADARWTAEFAFDFDGRGQRQAWANPVVLVEYRPDGSVDDDHSYVDLTSAPPRPAGARLTNVSATPISTGPTARWPSSRR